MSRGVFDNQPGVRAEIVQYYEVGLSLKWLAEKYFCSSTAIKRVLRQEGVTLRPKGGKRKSVDYHKVECAARMYHVEQMTFEEIGEQLGVHSVTVRYWFKRWEIPIRSNAEAQALLWSKRTPEERSAHGRVCWEGISEEAKRRFASNKDRRAA